MEETLQSLGAKIGAKIDEHWKKIDERFNRVDERFNKIDERLERVDQRFLAIEQQIGDVKSHLSIRIDELQGNVQLVLERFDDFVGKDEANSTAHDLDRRLERLDLRVLAMESTRELKKGGRKKVR
jgi:hypothetical protein